MASHGISVGFSSKYMAKMFSPAKSSNSECLTRWVLASSMNAKQFAELWTNVKVRIIEVIANIPPQHLELLALKKHCMEPTQGEEQASVLLDLLYAIVGLLCSQEGSNLEQAANTIRRSFRRLTKRQMLKLVHYCQLLGHAAGKVLRGLWTVEQCMWTWKLRHVMYHAKKGQ